MNNTTQNYVNEPSINYISFSLNYIIYSFIKLGMSLLLSFIIGFERELHSHPGGICTHTLVGIGSCLFTMTSVHLRDKYNVNTADPARICAQIVSGMGFLGSATIFKSNNYVKGINTAASLWISAAISMAIGSDFWELGFVASLFTTSILLINNRYKKYRYGKSKKNETDNSDIRLEEGLSYDAENAPYGHENTNID